MNDLTALLKLNEIQFGFLASDKPKSIKNAFDYTTGKNKDIKITNNDIPVDQDLGILTSVLFEPKHFYHYTYL